MTGINARFRLDWPGFTLDVDLALPGRGVTALFGPSGSGKTTLLRCIAGLERAPLGVLSVNGELWQDGQYWLPTHQRPLGYVFQEASLFPHLTVLGNLRYGLQRISAGNAGKQRASLEQAIELLGIVQLLERKPDRLSGGERSRVGMARALAVNPRLLLMDEPLAALDALTRVRLQDELLEIWNEASKERPKSALYITHAIDEALYLADRIIVMSDRPGRVLREITVPFARPREPEMRTLPEFHRLADEIWRLLRRPAA